MRLSIDDTRLAVSPISDGELERTAFACGLYSIGFEERSRFIATTLQTSKLVGIDLGGCGVASYDENMRQAKLRKDKIVKRDEIALSSSHDWLARPDLYPVSNIFVDISSMDRHTMSRVIYQLLRSVGDSETNLYVLYAPAEFRKPPPHQVPVESSGPINALLAGHPRDPRLPTILFLGLGYEVGLALGVVETFEPARVLAFIPRGRDKRFDHEVDRANAPLLADQGYIRRVYYSVQAPANAFLDLKERVLGMREQAKIVLVPLGPKIFSSMGILLGYIYTPDITVWRFSAQIDPSTANRRADETIVGYKLEVRPSGAGTRPFLGHS